MTEIKFEELVSTIRAIGDSYIQRSNGAIKWTPGWEKFLRNHYEPAKEKLKKDFTRNPDDLLDRHKVGAAILRSICLTKPIAPTEPGLIPPRFSQINSRLALDIAIFIVRRYGRQDAIEAKDPEAIKMHESNFIYPKAMNGDGEYEDQTIKAIAEATQNNTLDVFLVANMLYLLDIHHRTAFR